MDTLILNRKSCTSSSKECVQISPDDKDINDKLLSRIANHLILNASFLDNIGLYHGKMGIVLFFAHYAKYTENSLYDDFAGELLDEIYKEVHDGLSVDLANGLCGIGWGVLYLLQNGFMEGNPDDILGDIDKKIMERDLCRITDLSIETGLEGISLYIKQRLNLSAARYLQMPFDLLYISDWTKAISQLSDTAILELPSIIRIDKLEQEASIVKWKLGLDNGCAGYGIKILLR